MVWWCLVPLDVQVTRMSNSRARFECLEPRRMLDATAGPAIFFGDVENEQPGEVLIDMSSVQIPDHLKLSWFAPRTHFGRSGDTLAIVTGRDGSSLQQLTVIRETSPSQVEVLKQVNLADIAVDRLLLDGDRLLVIGQSIRPLHTLPFPENDPKSFAPQAQFVDGETTVMAFDLSSGALVKELKFPPGWIKAGHFENGKATIVIERSDLFYPMIFPPVEASDLLIRFQWTADGVSEPSRNDIPSGEVVVDDDTIAIAVQKYSFVDSVDNYISSIALRTFRLEASGVTPVGESMFENIGRVLRLDKDFALLVNDQSSSLFIVDLRPDADHESRVKEVPFHINVSAPGIRLAQDIVVFLGSRHGDLWTMNARGHQQVLVGISLEQGTLTVTPLDNRFKYASSLQLIDAATNSFGIDTFDWTRQFVFGSLSSGGRFVPEGKVAASHRNEVFYAEPDKVLVVTPGKLAAYSYIDTSVPLYEVRLTLEKPIPIEAKDDLVELYKMIGSSTVEGVNDIDMYAEVIDVLANDVIPHDSYHWVEVTELIDAPPGAMILWGRYVTIPFAAIPIAPTSGPLRFGYRISDGFSESQAEVTVALTTIAEQQREFMEDAVRAKAADDFSVPRDSIDIQPIDFNAYPNGFPQDLLENIGVAEGQSHINGRFLKDPFFFFRASTPTASAIYQVNLQGAVIRLDVFGNEGVELSVVAVNEAGEPIDTVNEGDSFWLEFRGLDLRNAPQGVFSSFLNLHVADHIILTDTVEPGPGFVFVHESDVANKVTDHTVFDLGVVSSTTNGRSGVPVLLLRILASAVSQGVVEFTPEIPVTLGAETTVFGLEQVVPEEFINRRSVRLQVVVPSEVEDPRVDSTDVNRDGSTHAFDALLVLNMMRHFGVGEVNEVASRVVAKEAEVGIVGATIRSRMSVARYDVNRDGKLTPLDALLILNHISRAARVTTIVPPLTKSTDLLIDDEKDVDAIHESVVRTTL